MVRVATRGRYRVYVWRERGGRHHAPHCHVEWADGSCVIAVDTLAVLAGRATPQARQLVRDYQEEIRNAWISLNSTRP